MQKTPGILINFTAIVHTKITKRGKGGWDFRLQKNKRKTLETNLYNILY